jgi:methyl-accepting chemotaxis protein
MRSSRAGSVRLKVRSLAQRSAQAAREIKVLIGCPVERVEAGAGRGAAKMWP